MKKVSLNVVASVLGITPRRWNQLVKDKGAPKAGRGQYPLVECVQWYIEFIRKGVDDERRAQKHEEELKQSRLENKLLELKIGEKQSEFIRVEEVGAIVEPMIAAIRSILLPAPKRIAVKLGKPELEEELKPYFREALNECAVIPKAILSAPSQRVDESIRSVPSAARADHQPVGGRKAHPRRNSRKR